MLRHTAFGMRRTRIAVDARIATAFVDAGQSGGALVVRTAFGLLLGDRIGHLAVAVLEWIAD